MLFFDAKNFINFIMFQMFEVKSRKMRPKSLFYSKPKHVKNKKEQKYPTYVIEKKYVYFDYIPIFFDNNKNSGIIFYVFAISETMFTNNFKNS